MTKSEVTPERLRDTGSGSCSGDPDVCIRVAERSAAVGVAERMLAIQIRPSTPPQDAMNTRRLCGKDVLPHGQEQEHKAQAAQGALRWSS